MLVAKLHFTCAFPRMPGVSVVLVGYRGSGKTTVGRKLADRLWQPFVDVDEQIVARAGKSIKAIFEEQGEPAFRALEADVLAGACRAKEDQVISAGGGAVERPENRALLRAAGHSVIYLRCEPAELLRRISGDPTTADARPNLTALGGGIDEIQAMLARREPLYREVMTRELDVTNLTPGEAVVYIVRLL